MITVTPNEFLEATGIVLLTVLPDNVNSADGVDRRDEHFLNRQARIIENFIKSRTQRYNSDNLSETLKNEVKTAIIEQAQYTLMTNDYTLISGFNMTSGLVVNRDTRRDITISTVAEDILLNAGLLYRGIR